MAALSFATTSKRAKRKSEPSLLTILIVAALAGGAGYVFMPAGVSLAAIPGLSDLPAIPGLPALQASPEANPAPLSAPAAKPVGHKSTDPAPPSIAGIALVIDGDTLDILGERVRLQGVDAPAARQQCKDGDGAFWRCGQVAAKGLETWIAGSPVSCTTHGRETRGRLLASCTVRGESLQEWLASHGYAIANRQVAPAYGAAEDAARAKKVGLWAGEFVPPSAWRKGLRLEGEQPSQAMIEGKVAAN